jgi:hypothetical protein
LNQVHEPFSKALRVVEYEDIRPHAVWLKRRFDRLLFILYVKCVRQTSDEPMKRAKHLDVYQSRLYGHLLKCRRRIQRMVDLEVEIGHRGDHKGNCCRVRVQKPWEQLVAKWKEAYEDGGTSRPDSLAEGHSSVCQTSGNRGAIGAAGVQLSELAPMLMLQDVEWPIRAQLPQ